MLKAGEKVGGSDAVIEDKERKGPVTDDELAGLSDAERAALAAEDDDVDVLKKVAGADDDDDPDAEAEAEKAAAAKAAAEKDAEEKAAADAEAKRKAELDAMSAEDRKKAEEADAKARQEADEEARRAAASSSDDEDDDPVVPVFKAPPVEDYEGKMKALDDAHSAATKDYQDNKLTLDEMLAEHNRVERERRELDQAKVKADISSEFGEQNAEQLWLRDIRRFIGKTAREDGIDYGKPALNAALDAEVKRLAGDKANADKPGPWFLEQADRNIRAELGLTGRKGEDAETKAKRDAAAKEEAEKARKLAASKERGKAPKSIGAAPAAAAEGTNDGEFAHLDALEGLELENAVARMSPEAQDRYARS